MRHLYLLLGLVVTLTSSLYSQSLEQEFKKYSIQNSSCELLNAVSKEVNLSTNSQVQQFLSTRRADLAFNSQSDVDSYLKDFDATLSRTKQKYEAQEVLWKTGAEMGKYGINVLGNFAEALPTKYLTNFITPAVHQGFELYVSNAISEAVESHRNDLDKIIQDRVNLLYSNGIDVTTANDQKAFEDLFAVAHADIPALKREDYPVFNRELIKRAFDFIAKNRADIELLNLRTNGQYENAKALMQNQLQMLEKEITTKVDTDLKELGYSISALAKNQEAIFTTLKTMQGRIASNEKRIRVLEKEMAQVQMDVDQLKAKQDEHSKLISQNQFQIDILSGYTFQNLNTDQKIAALRQGHFDNIFQTAEKNKLLNELNEIKTKETIISVSKTVESYAGIGYQALVQSGLLKGKDAQNVGKLLYGVSIVTGIARVYAGDFSGFTSILSGIGGLFGKPQESAEVQMLRQMHQAMNERFDKIDANLAIINTKIDTLTSMIYNMYKGLAFAMQYTSDQLDRMEWKINNMNSKATAFLYKDYQACKTLKDIWDRRKITFTRYSDYQTNYNATCQKCLEGLNDFTIGKNLNYFTVSFNEQLKNERVVLMEVVQIYEPTKDLFKHFHSANLNEAMNGLMFPFKRTNEVNRPLYVISRLKNLRTLDNRDVLDSYYSYEMIPEFTDMMLRFSPYFEAAGSNSNFAPMPVSQYLTSNNANGVNQDLLEFRLLKLLDLTQFAISQQSLLAGNLMLDPMYSTLFGYSTDNTAINLSVKVLGNNKLLAANFASLLINKNIVIQDSARLMRLFDQNKANKQNIDTLNSLIRYDDFRFEYNEQDKKFYLTFKRQNQDIKILCPNNLTILENKMINTDAIFLLIKARDNINSRLIDLTFSSNVGTSEVTAERFKYLSR